MTTNVTEPETEVTTPRRRNPRVVAATVAGATLIGGGFAALVLAYGPVTTNPSDGAFPVGGKTMVHPSDEVKRLQEALTRVDLYDGPIDGFRSPRTKAAITDLQREAGLGQTGQMNPASWAALTAMLVEERARTSS